MPQNPRTTNDIIMRSYYLMGELSPDELPTASQISEGLYYLNDLLDFFSSSGIFIPFVTELKFNLVANQDKYTISNNVPADVVADQIVEIDYCNVIRDNISYPVRLISRSELFNNTRLVNIKTRPGLVILNRQELFSEIQFYPTPVFPYECNLRIKSYLDSLELLDVLNEIPRFYYRFLRYALARELSSVFPSSSWTPKLEKEYEFMYQQVVAATDIDMTIYPDNILMDPFGELTYEAFGIFS